jgi:glycosyltransferase involved in cell wall biosynthesis
VNILIYFPYNLRTVEQQSVMEMLIKQGHKVFFLSTCENGFLHGYLEKLGVKVFAATPSKEIGKFPFYLLNFRKLASVIKGNNIEVVIAHQQIPAIIAGLLKKIKKFKLIYVRHNSDEDYLLNATKAKWFNKIANWLTPIKVAPSSVVQNHWLKHENAKVPQVQRVNYGYNFDQYEDANPKEVERIKNEFPTSLRILSMARLVPVKRHALMFEIVNRLVKTGLNCKLLCLGSGQDEELLKNKIKELKLEQHVFLLGRKDNVFDYIEASDVFMHLSSTEASNSAVKEVGLMKKPVIVCKGVGDFEDYIVNGENGFLVDKENPGEATYSILTQLAMDENYRKKIGERLRQTVLQEFDIDNIVTSYDQLLHAAI